VIDVAFDLPALGHSLHHGRTSGSASQPWLLGRLVRPPIGRLLQLDSTERPLQSKYMRLATNAQGVASASGRESTATAADGGLNEKAREALQGSPLAVRHFLQEIAPLVRSICRGIMGREHLDLEDTIQDSLVEVMRALPQFRFEADVSHYVTKIVMRRAISVRQRSRLRSQQRAAMKSCVDPVTPFDDRIEVRTNLVRNLLCELGEPQSTVLRLRLMLGHSIGEIARITGVSVNTVKTRLRLGKGRLRRRLEQSGESPSER
jgi:RNA polymerase sigma-70 factor, ECF subfamily